MHQVTGSTACGEPLDQWNASNSQNLARAYGNDEPEYTWLTCKQDRIHVFGIILTNANEVARHLRAYGEETTASKVADLTASDFVRIGQRAFDYACMPTTKKSGGGMLFAKAIACAAVEIIEGSPRELRRKRRAFT